MKIMEAGKSHSFFYSRVKSTISVRDLEFYRELHESVTSTKSVFSEKSFTKIQSFENIYRDMF